MSAHSRLAERHTTSASPGRAAEARYAEVAVPLPVRTTFHYRIPSALRSRAQVGGRVQVPFGHRRLVGTLVGLSPHSPVRRLRPIEALLDDLPAFDPSRLDLARWMASVYQAGWGETLAAALPSPLRRGLKEMKPRKEEEEPSVCPTGPLRLNPEQERAFLRIAEPIRSRRHQVFLLHGVTGSGKTEVYLQAIQEVLSLGRSAIVLVPEVSLTPQAIERFQGRFGPEAVAVLHSGMLESRRLLEWNRVRLGQARVVVGARSAVFAPAPNLGVVVVDEEHEPTYKQEDVPRYHARDVAIRRGELVQAPVVLGSATPSLESYYRASLGREGESPAGKGFELLELRERVEDLSLPAVQVVDMREELAVGRRNRIFSRALEEALAQTLKGRQQAILFLNRRGFSTFVHCPKCGHVLRCKSCQVSLTYHSETRQLVCHSCQAASEAPELCPRCRGDYVRFHGVGTERVESELARLFPEAAIARMDADATRVRGSHAKILKAFSEHRVDVLVGTQMIAKGLDYPRVTLVGVISADTALNLPDFRSAERTFHLLTQVAGRAGRGDMPGRVIIQTFAPHHYAIQAARNHDYASFYRQELAIRRDLHLPPFSRLARLVARSAREATASKFAEQMAAQCRSLLGGQAQVVGPAPAMVPRLRRQYRWQVLLKAPSLSLLEKKLPMVLERCRPPKGCHLAVDVDPL